MRPVTVVAFAVAGTGVMGAWWWGNWRWLAAGVVVMMLVEAVGAVWGDPNVEDDEQTPIPPF